MFTLNNHFQKAIMSEILSKRQILRLKRSPFGSKNKKSREMDKRVKLRLKHEHRHILVESILNSDNNDLIILSQFQFR